ncbi:hypothetical protein [uncultured Microscilla sp.]|uniref:hypothetical protein n=1 Tax=uncultured Microscilla sp. TaxID=432653 RepID=UPI00261B6CB6|nr:hypothetical protein [uncultured Microscilla sp.]
MYYREEILFCFYCLYTTGAPQFATGTPQFTTGESMPTTGMPIPATGALLLTARVPLLATGVPLLTTANKLALQSTYPPIHLAYCAEGVTFLKSFFSFLNNGVVLKNILPSRWCIQSGTSTYKPVT